MRVGLSAASAEGDGATEETGNFRLTFSKFRAYGVTKAELIVWLLRELGIPVVANLEGGYHGPGVGCEGIAPGSTLRRGRVLRHHE